MQTSTQLTLNHEICNVYSPMWLKPKYTDNVNDIVFFIVWKIHLSLVLSKHSTQRES